MDNPGLEQTDLKYIIFAGTDAGGNLHSITHLKPSNAQLVTTTKNYCTVIPPVNICTVTSCIQ